MNTKIFSNIKGDLFGGLTAGIIALPLALAFGEASGAGPIAGLYGAILVGFFAALFGGTGTQISGPTGPMVVVFAGLYATLDGRPELVFTAVILAGVIQILFGVLKLGQYIRLVPYPVISGFMSGIGVIIIALQLSRLFGHEPEGTGTIPSLMAVPGAVADPNFIALGIGLLTLAIIFFWPKALGKFVPPALAALIIGTLVSMGLAGAPVLGAIPTGLPEMVLPSFDQDNLLIVVEAAFILALLGAIDSLLTSLVADNMTKTKHNSDKELIGQGIGNAFAGLFSAIPGAGATMRTVINIRTGGQTQLSGIIHSLLLLMIVLVLAPFAAHIPHAVLAAILVKVGYDIIDVPYLKQAHKGPRWDLLLMVLVLLLTVFVDLITAVMVGVVMASLAFVKQMADAQLKSVSEQSPAQQLDYSDEERKIMEDADGKIVVFDFGGPLSFGAAADLSHQIREHSHEFSEVLILNFSSVPFIDVSAARAVETVGCDARKADIRVLLCGMNDKVAKILHGLDATCCIKEEQYMNSRTDAIVAAKDYIAALNEENKDA